METQANRYCRSRQGSANARQRQCRGVVAAVVCGHAHPSSQRGAGRQGLGNQRGGVHRDEIRVAVDQTDLKRRQSLSNLPTCHLFGAAARVAVDQTDLRQSWGARCCSECRRRPPTVPPIGSPAEARVQPPTTWTNRASLCSQPPATKQLGGPHSRLTEEEETKFPGQSRPELVKKPTSVVSRSAPSSDNSGSRQPSSIEMNRENA